MILVTGAAGRLGQRVVRRLINKGYHVLGTDKMSYENSPSPFVQAELCQAERVKDLVTNAEAVMYETLQNNTLITLFPWDTPTVKMPRTVVMWAYADPRDVAEAHVLGLETDIDGH